MNEGFDVGGIFARLGAKFDDDGFDRFERRLRKVRQDARNDVETDLKADVDTRGFDRYSRAIKGAERDADRAERSSRRVGTALGGVGRVAAGAAAGGFIALGLGARKAIQEFEEAARVAGQTEAVLKSTGGAANVTAGEIERLATAISNKTGIDDEAIQSGQNLLLTFTNIRNEAGAGNDVFNQATGIITDMSVALGQDMKSSAIQVGKALQDPIRGITALRRVGVAFTDDQKAQIETLVESGRTMEAQKLIMAELTREFGGSAEAQARPLDKLRTTINNLFEDVGQKLAPVLSKAAEGLSKFLGQLSSGEGAGGRFAKIVRGIASAVGDVGRWLVGTFSDVREAFSGGDRDASRFAQNVKRHVLTVVALFRDFGRSIERAFKGVQPELSTIARAIGRVAEVLLAVFRRVAPGIKAAFDGIANVIRGAIQVIAGILTLDFGKAWDGVKRIFSGALRAIGGLMRAASAPIREAASRVWRGITGGVEAAWEFITGIFKDGLDFILGGVTSLLGVVEDMLNVASKIPGVGGKFDDLRREVAKAREGLDEYRESLRDVDRQHGRTKSISDRKAEIRKLRDELRGLNRNSDDYRITARSLRIAEAKLAEAEKDRRTQIRRTADLVKEGGGIMSTYIGDLTVRFGASPSDFPALANRGARRAEGGYAATGWIGRPGEAGRDNVHIVVGRGEAILNRHQQPLVDRALRAAYGFGLRGLFGRVRRPHFMAEGGYAVGGEVGDVPRPTIQGMGQATWKRLGQRGIDITRGAALQAAEALQGEAGVPYGSASPDLMAAIRQGGRFGLALSSFLRPGDPGFHGRGRAADLAGSPGAMARFFRWALGHFSRITELFYDPLGAIDNNVRIPAIGGHSDHVHIAFNKGGLAFEEGGIADIPASLVTGLRDASELGSSLPSDLQDRIRKLLAWALPEEDEGTARTPGRARTPAIRGHDAAANRLRGRAELRRMRFGDGQWPPLRELWDGESGWEETARNPSSGAYGIPQALPPSKMGRTAQGRGAVAALAQIRWGLRYIKGRYGSPARALSAWRSRRPHWYAEGGFVDELPGFEGGGFADTLVPSEFRQADESVDSSSSSPIPGIRKIRRDIDDLNTKITRRSRDHERSEEVLITEGTETEPPVLNVEAIEQRVAELEEIKEYYDRIRRRLQDLYGFIKEIITAYGAALGRIRAAITSVSRRLQRLQGARRPNREAIGQAQRDLTLLTQRHDLYSKIKQGWTDELPGVETEIWDAAETVKDFDQEIAAVRGTQAPTGSTTLVEPLLEGEISPAAAAEATARAASEQYQAFIGQQADLFSSFGANFLGRGQIGAFPPDLALAAGLRQFGAIGVAGARDAAGAAGGDFTQINHFAEPPPDPHAFAKTSEFEFRTAFR